MTGEIYPHHFSKEDAHSYGTGRLSINLKNLVENYRIMQKQAQKSEVAAVVKANAYGLGIAEVVNALHKDGCTSFFVATFDEALAVRELVPDAQVFALNGVWTGVPSEYVHHNITPVLNSLPDLEIWQLEYRRAGKSLPAIIHTDTGMNRLGLSVEDVGWLAEHRGEALEGIDVRYIMSHLSSADELTSPETGFQYECFQEIRGLFPDIPATLANSSGIFRSPDYHFDLVRPGIGLYGSNPTPETDNPMKPVVNLEVPVLQVHHVKEGESIGYNTTYYVAEDEVVATVCLGYADGMLRSLSNQGCLYWNGYPCPIRGRVSMDLITVSLSRIEGELPKAGDMMEVLGAYQDIDALAASADTISYEILTSLGRRYRRTYI